MSFGGDDSSPPAPYYPPIPPKEELLDVIDHITGTQTITVTGPDGKKKRVIERLPRTAEEQKLYEDAGELMSKAIVEIKRLSAYDPAAVVDFAPFVNVMNDLNIERQADLAELSKLPDFNQYVSDFKAMEQTIIQEEFNKQANEASEYLNRRGYGDSTGAAELKTALASQKAKTLAQSKVNATMYGEQLKAADQTNRQNAFGFREQGRMGQLQNAQTEHQLKLDQYSQANAMRQQALQNQGGLFNVGAKIRGEDKSTAMATRAPELANTIFQQSNMDNLNRHNAHVNQINAQYQNQLSSYQNQQPSFGDFAMNAGLTVGTGMLFANPGSVAGKFGAKLFGV